MKGTLQSFATFAETRKKLLADRAKLESAAKRDVEAKRYSDLLGEFQVSNVAELDEERRTAFFAALLGETEELETEGNAFGAAVKKAKEEGEDEFEVDGKTYKVEQVEVENEGNAFGAAVKKAKEEGEDEFEVGGETYKVTEKKSLNEALALQIGNKRAAKKVVTQLNRIFTKQLPDLQQMGKEGIYGCVKYFLDYALTDANFHTEKPAVVKAIRKANIPGIEVKLPGLGGYHAKISGSRIKEILHQYAGQISNAAGWSGQGIVEGCALYLYQFHKDDATGTAMINAFNSQFEGEAVRVDVSKKINALNESFDIFEAEVKDDESFTEYVKSVYSEAFGEDYDEEKAVKAAQGMLKKSNGDYGAAVGMCKASLG